MPVKGQNKFGLVLEDFNSYEDYKKEYDRLEKKSHRLAHKEQIKSIINPITARIKNTLQKLTEIGKTRIKNLLKNITKNTQKKTGVRLMPKILNTEHLSYKQLPYGAT